VLIVEKAKAAMLEPPVSREKPSVVPEAEPAPPPEPEPEPVPEVEVPEAPPLAEIEEPEPIVEEEVERGEREEKLPPTASGLPLTGLIGLLSMLAAAGIRLYRLL
jgi:hypothetical protein